MPELTHKVALFFNEDNFLSIEKLTAQVATINKYEHLLKRVEQKDVDAMIQSNIDN